MGNLRMSTLELEDLYRSFLKHLFFFLSLSFLLLSSQRKLSPWVNCLLENTENGASENY